MPVRHGWGSRRDPSVLRASGEGRDLAVVQPVPFHFPVYLSLIQRVIHFRNPRMSQRVWLYFSPCGAFS